MTHENIDILTNIDQYNITLGLERNDVRSILGEPSSIDRYDISEDNDIECWNYDSHQLELIFETDSGFKLAKMSFFSKETRYKNIAIVGMKEKTLLKKIPELYLEDEKDEFGYSYEFPGENVLIWVDAKRVENISIYC